MNGRLRHGLVWACLASALGAAALASVAGDGVPVYTIVVVVSLDASARGGVT